MIKCPYLKKLIMPILMLLLWAVLVLFPLPSSAQALLEAVVGPSEEATTSPVTETTSSTTEIISTNSTPQIEGAAILTPTVAVRFPYMPVRNYEQSGLKAGDRFSVQTDSIGLTFTEASIDLHELGFGSAVPMNKQSAGVFYTDQLILPSTTPDGMKTFVVHAKDGIRDTSTLQGTVVVDNVPPTGTLKATFTRNNDLTGQWTGHVSGTFKGTGSDGRILNEYTYGVDKDGKHMDGGYTSDADTILRATSPFSLDLPIIAPGISWVSMGYGVTLADQAGNLTEVESTPVPIVRPNVPLIDHAINGSVVAPTAYKNIPSGVGIPYSLINSLPNGDYYAVVFFDGVNGCPSSNYAISAFVPGSVWGVGVRPDLYQKAYRSKGGGCMQEFNIDPTKGDEWLWGALSNTGSAPAIADKNGIPAFAICATAAVCDPIAPLASIIAPEPTGISNVLFIPGIEGSNLYQHNNHCNDASGVCDASLWLPPNNSFVPKLFLDADGKSLDDGIYTKDGDILTQAYGKKFYASFTQGLNELQANGKFGVTWKWKAIAYDWRLSLADIVHNGVERNGRIYYEEASSTPYIEQELRKLAATSKTGKVTIIAHSNGGLVAKALMNKLGYEEADKLVDKVVFVGTPQSGVPEAVGALLYGDKQGIPNMKYVPNILMSTANARTLGLNSPMAYSLLPVDTYFNDVIDTLHPVLSFTADTLWGKERTQYGKSITNPTDLQSFALAREGGRAMPAPSNLKVPNILNAQLYEDALLGHIPLDGWIPPMHVKVYQIAGWGADTVSGIDLYERPETVLGVPTGGYQPEHRLSFVEDGDGSVTVPSALMMISSEQVKRYWENLPEAKKGTHSYTHTDLFEIPQLQTFLHNLIAGSEDMLDTIYAAQPRTTNQSKKLIFTLHSVADFDLSDENGNHTSTIGGTIDESIPGSTLGELGDTQYAIAPSGQQYQLAIHGTSTEPFTLDIQEMVGNVVTASTTIADVPSTDKTVAVLSITNGIADASPLAVDTDGDGATDYSVSPVTGTVMANESPTPSTNPAPPTVNEKPETTSGQAHSQSATTTNGSSTSTSTNGNPARATSSAVASSTRVSKAIASSTLPTRHALPTTLPLPISKHASTTNSSARHQASITASTSEKTPYVENNQMAAIPESQFLRLLVSLANILSKLIAYAEGVIHAI
jgi:pimeloyl-ACP methyl ester carboxylesterase